MSGSVLIDTHCHLYMAPLDADPDAVLARARDAGVTDCIVPAYDPASWDAVAALSRRDGVHAAYGLHPWVAGLALDTDALRSRLVGGACAIGEIGLDFKIPDPDREAQIDVFRRQLDLAAELDLPVILHNRGAFEHMISILSEYDGAIRGVVHAFSRGPELGQRFLDLGLYLAFGGAITRPRAKQARRSATVAPVDRILLETDAPSIGLDGVGPENVEPRHVLEIARALAILQECDTDRIARTTTANAKTLFGFS